jgi:hypothetical protein
MNLIEYKGDEIIVSKYGAHKMRDWILVSIFVPILLWFFLPDASVEGRTFMAFASALFLPILFYFQSKTRIIFDLKQRIVYSEMPLRGNTKLIDFADIHAIEFVGRDNWVASLVSKKKMGHYRIARKTDPFAKGISILENIDINDPKLRDMQLHDLPALRAAVSDTGPNATSPPRAPQAAITPVIDPYVHHQTALVYLKESPECYSFYDWRIFSTLCWLGFLWLGLWFGWQTVQNGVHESSDVYVPLVLIPLFLWLSFSNTNYFRFDNQRRVIYRAYIFGLLAKEFSYDDFVTFETVRRTHNGIYVGTDLSMSFRDGSSLAVTTYYNTKKIDALTREIVSVLRSL